MKLEDIVSEWDKDCKMNETELGDESVKIPVLHNKYLKIFIGESAQLKRLFAQRAKLKRTLTEYYLGELDRDELDQLGRDQFYKKILKNEVETYIESDDDFIEINLKFALQQEKVNYIEAVIKSINNRGFQIKNALDWLRFTNG
jgi:translation initiation factor 2 beta subunit (eIF-2beta)/eIF-5